MKKVVCFIHDIYEDLELWYPKIRLEESGIEVVVAGPEVKVYKGKHGYPCQANQAINAIQEASFDGILIPGGYAPDKLRRIPQVLQLVREFDLAKKTIAFICHGGWVPISAKILKGKKVTGAIAIKDDLENAGAVWKDEPIVIDGHLISSRAPLDLYLFGKAIAEQLFFSKV